MKNKQVPLRSGESWPPPRLPRKLFPALPVKDIAAIIAPVSNTLPLLSTKPPETLILEILIKEILIDDSSFDCE
jgi:hypothetical protein